MKHRRGIVLMVLMMMAVAGSSFGDQGEIGDLPYSWSGHDIPRVYLVEVFFVMADSFIQVDSEDQEFRQYFLRDLGLEPGTKSESIFMHALERARVLRYGAGGPETRIVTEKGPDVTEVLERGRYPGPNPRANEPMDVSLARRDERTVQRARELANIYYDLQQELQEEGVSFGEIESFIDSHVAAGSHLSSDVPGDTPRPEAIAFENQLEKRSREN